jgi:hypothetical protein
MTGSLRHRVRQFESRPYPPLHSDLFLTSLFLSRVFAVDMCIMQSPLCKRERLRSGRSRRPSSGSMRRITSRRKCAYSTHLHMHLHFCLAFASYPYLRLYWATGRVLSCFFTYSHVPESFTPYHRPFTPSFNHWLLGHPGLIATRILLTFTPLFLTCSGLSTSRRRSFLDPKAFTDCYNRVYDMALFSYLIAFGHFSSEVLIFRTAGVNFGTISPFLVSCTCTLYSFLMFLVLFLSLPSSFASLVCTRCVFE